MGELPNSIPTNEAFEELRPQTSWEARNYVMTLVERAASFNPLPEDLVDLQTAGTLYVFGFMFRDPMINRLYDAFNEMADQIEGIDPDIEEKIQAVNI